MDRQENQTILDEEGSQYARTLDLQMVQSLDGGQEGFTSNAKGETPKHDLENTTAGSEGKLDSNSTEKENPIKKVEVAMEVRTSFSTLSKPVIALDYMFTLYGKCILNKELRGIRFTTGALVQRPVETTFRIGYEVFLCPKFRHDALGRTFLF